jgi:hypothetical protein
MYEENSNGYSEHRSSGCSASPHLDPKAIDRTALAAFFVIPMPDLALLLPMVLSRRPGLLAFGFHCRFMPFCSD